MYEKVVAAKTSWSGLVKEGQRLKITDLEGQQAVDFLCYDNKKRSNRYCATNTLKVQGNVYIGLGSILYADDGSPLLEVVEDTIGRHDTVYGCCSNPNNFLRYGVITTESCYTNFETELAKNGMGIEAIVPNINWFMSVPVLEDGSAGVDNVVLKPNSYVTLLAKKDTLAVLSNCPQMHNRCNGYNPTPIKVKIF